jgi:hypothetical protein
VTPETETTIEARVFLRHMLATLAYRGGKAIRNAPDSFAAYKSSPTTRTPIEILAHIGDLMEWGLAMAREKPVYKEATPLPWPKEVERFFATVTAFDSFLASDAPLAARPGKIFQGPIADALTHVGQINMLRRMADAPVRGENYYRASIAVGQTGADQPAPNVEFD